jgi:hypothetical protein
MIEGALDREGRKKLSNKEIKKGALHEDEKK